jgi:signal transduction histidine kinase
VKQDDPVTATRPRPEDFLELVQRAARRRVLNRSAIMPGTGSAQADEDRIHLILANLLSNAIRHSHEGGKVTLRAAAVGDLLRQGTRSA